MASLAVAVLGVAVLGMGSLAVSVRAVAVLGMGSLAVSVRAVAVLGMGSLAVSVRAVAVLGIGGLAVAVLGVAVLAVAVLRVRTGTARLAESILGERPTGTGLTEAVRAETGLSAVVLGVVVPGGAGTIEPERRVSPGRLIARDLMGLTVLAVSRRLAMAGLAVIVRREGGGLLRVSAAGIARGWLTAEAARSKTMPTGRPLAVARLLAVLELAVVSLAVALVSLGRLGVADPAVTLLLAVPLLVASRPANSAGLFRPGGNCGIRRWLRSLSRTPASLDRPTAAGPIRTWARSGRSALALRNSPAREQAAARCPPSGHSRVARRNPGEIRSLGPAQHLNPDRSPDPDRSPGPDRIPGPALGPVAGRSRIPGRRRPPGRSWWTGRSAGPDRSRAAPGGPREGFPARCLWLRESRQAGCARRNPADSPAHRTRRVLRAPHAYPSCPWGHPNHSSRPFPVAWKTAIAGGYTMNPDD